MGEPAENLDPSPAPSNITDQDPTAAPAPQTWPDAWRNNMTGIDVADSYSEDDQKILTQADRFKSPQDVWKSMREGQKFISEHKPATARPTEDSTDEDVAKYREENGIPAEAKDYNLDYDDGTVIGDDVRDRLQGFLDYSHGQNASNDAVKDTVKWYLNDVEEQQTAIKDMNDEARVNGISDLKSEWGGEFQGNMNALSGLFVSAPEGTMDSLLNASDDTGLKFANNPDNIRWLVGLAKELNPTASLVPPGPDQAASIDARLSEIQGWMSSSDPVEKAKYWKDEKVQKEMVALTQAKQKGNS